MIYSIPHVEVRDVDMLAENPQPIKKYILVNLKDSNKPWDIGGDSGGISAYKHGCPLNFPEAQYKDYYTSMQLEKQVTSAMMFKIPNGLVETALYYVNTSGSDKVWWKHQITFPLGDGNDTFYMELYSPSLSSSTSYNKANIKLTRVSTSREAVWQFSQQKDIMKIGAFYDFHTWRQYRENTDFYPIITHYITKNGVDKGFVWAFEMADSSEDTFSFTYTNRGPLLTNIGAFSMTTINSTQYTDPFPPSEDDGGDGQGQPDEGDTPDPTTDNVDTDTTSFINCGFITPYVMSSTVMGLFASKLWSSSITTKLALKLLKPMDAILDYFMLPIQAPLVTGQRLIVAGLDFELTCQKISEAFTYVDLGTISVPTNFGGFLDYNGYSNLRIYLPCLGFRSLNVNNYMGKKIHLLYKVCNYDGNFTVFVSQVSTDGVTKKVLDTFNGNMAFHMPVTSGGQNFLTMMGSVASLAPINLFNGSLGNSVIQNIGNLNGSSAIMSSMTPYLMIDCPMTNIPQKYGHLHGYNSNITRKLSELNGYTIVSDIHIDNIAIMDTEKEKLKEILKKGINI